MRAVRTITKIILNKDNTIIATHSVAVATAYLVAKLFGKSWLNESPWVHVLRLLLAPNELYDVTNNKTMVQYHNKRIFNTCG
jgi:hypothetical protein